MSRAVVLVASFGAVACQSAPELPPDLPPVLGTIESELTLVVGGRESGGLPRPSEDRAWLELVPDGAPVGTRAVCRYVHGLGLPFREGEVTPWVAAPSGLTAVHILYPAESVPLMIRFAWPGQNTGQVYFAPPDGAAFQYWTTVAFDGDWSTLVRVDRPGLWTVGALALRPAPLRQFSVVVGVAQATAVDAAALSETGLDSLVRGLLMGVEQVFNQPGVLRHAIQLAPNYIYTFEGDAELEHGRGPAGYDLRIVLAARPGSGPSADGDAGSITDERGVLLRRWGAVFDDGGVLALSHELGHWFGAYDLADLELAQPADNPVTGHPYRAPASIMNQPQLAERRWDRVSAGIIDAALDEPPIRMRRTELLPSRMSLRTLRMADDGVLAGAQLRLYPKACSATSLQATAALEGQTGPDGTWELPPAAFSMPAAGDAAPGETCLFLVEARYGTNRNAPERPAYVDYAWVPILAANQAALAGQPYQVVIRLGRGDVDKNGQIDVSDALLVAQYVDGTLDQEQAPTFYPAAADADCNGRIETEDAYEIQQLQTQLISRFFCPPQ